MKDVTESFYPEVLLPEIVAEFDVKNYQCLTVSAWNLLIGV